MACEHLAPSYVPSGPTDKFSEGFLDFSWLVLPEDVSKRVRAVRSSLFKGVLKLWR